MITTNFFPHPSYAEDQPLAKTILTSHVAHRSVQTGALSGAFLGLYRVRRAASVLTSTPTSNAIPLSRLAIFLRPAGTAAAVAVPLGIVATVGRMWGREDIEWRDRAWRLQENVGQVSVDRWSAAGAVVGLGAATTTLGAKMLTRDWRLVLGAVGIGSLVGTAGSMGFRGMS